MRDLALFFLLLAAIFDLGEVKYDDYRVIVVDGCEYLYKAGVYRESIAHKGNCKYCAQRDSINQRKLFVNEREHKDNDGSH